MIHTDHTYCAIHSASYISAFMHTDHTYTHTMEHMQMKDLYLYGVHLSISHNLAVLLACCVSQNFRITVL